MAFSSVLRAFLVAAVVAGCAHARSASRPATPSTGSTASTGSKPAPDATVGGRSSAPSGAPAVLDPSEEITPEELASIPEPVPPSPAPPKIPPKAPDTAPEASNPSTPAPSPSEPESTPSRPVPHPVTGDWIWRVQILATPDRTLADEVAREAADRLGSVSRVDAESGVFKVRLGGFASERDAAELKSRAVEMGYPGAFRVKIRNPKSDG